MGVIGWLLVGWLVGWLVSLNIYKCTRARAYKIFLKKNKFSAKKFLTDKKPWKLYY